MFRLTAYLKFIFLKILYPNNFIGWSLSYISISSNFHLSKYSLIKGRIIALPHSKIYSSGELIIGNNLCINSYSRIISFDKIHIGDNVTIAQFVTILDHDHKLRIQVKNPNGNFLSGYTTGTIEIGNNVWIGDKVTILKNVRIGNNVIIGANSLVIKDIPSNCVVGGVPAKILKNLL